MTASIRLPHSRRLCFGSFSIQFIATLLLTTHCSQVKRFSSFTTYRAYKEIESIIAQQFSAKGTSSSSSRLPIPISKQPSTPAPPTAAGKGDFTKAIQNNTVYKERSKTTHYNTHVPDIQSRLSAAGAKPSEDKEKTILRVAVLGSSGVERFKTTGECRTVLGDSMLERYKTTSEYT